MKCLYWAKDSSLDEVATVEIAPEVKTIQDRVTMNENFSNTVTSSTRRPSVYYNGPRNISKVSNEWVA
jgi:hypothetical protein